MSVALSHNYPLVGSLKAVNASGDPIQGVEVRVYAEPAFSNQELDTWVGQTTTDLNGEWIDPIIVDDGLTWVVHFEKPTEYGPVHVEVTT